MLALLRTIRPHQWVKNAFVAAPLVFSRHLEDRAYLAREALAVLAFCMLSGAVYAFNDVRDVEADRRHPTKKYRPIAAGELSERTALVASAILAIVAIAGCLALHWQLAVWAGLYFAQNIAYSVRLKHVAFVDVTLLASGFILRVLAGAAAIAVPPSAWLLACTALLALFFGLGKRAHELAWANASSGAAGSTATRAALSGYRLSVVKPVIYVLAVATCAAYVAYTLDVGPHALVYSAPFVAIGIVRFLSLALWRPRIDSPTDAMLRDPWFLLDLVAATATVLYIIYR
ncbi:MAG TPA: UbiA prenyltransferase family protein [Kofleriaceae bacterium]|nr:UbiA prenyltransferase family protein [Kofleriaceae bacterium]